MGTSREMALSTNVGSSILLATKSQHVAAGPIGLGVASGAMAEPEPSAEDQLAELRLSEEERLVLAKVADVLRRIQFGTVVLVVQDGKVVQIEMAEKFRLR